ncbi:hypothetical protein LDENG_00206200 [Lucifuga dentata]|nr:hypothetical protein LDENG_00206200 [Lucifuga dentata]
MIVSNVTCMKTEYIRLKHAKWMVWSFKEKIISVIHFISKNWMLFICIAFIIFLCTFTAGIIIPHFICLNYKISHYIIKLHLCILSFLPVSINIFDTVIKFLMLMNKI